ncbi:hypothetical protein TrRE_jg12414 [Triparma retinervis]|uniref:Uncharacterized protein n=1 Tax=Triparma retinervis TaxID=2557542 RepID=A0A9W7E614_9STRA|nr:hypothetical protein TrRE_jg12414 [Triparma retinervis]
MRRDGTVVVMSHDPSLHRSHRKSVGKDEVDDLISDHLAFNHTIPGDNASASAPEDTPSAASEDASAELARQEMIDKYGDYRDFEASQASHLDIGRIITDAGIDRAARDELKRRVSLSYSLAHPGTVKVLKKVPRAFVPAYPTMPTAVEVLDHNNRGTYYIARESYGLGHGGPGKFGRHPFTIYTIRDCGKHRVATAFCLSPLGPRHCPLGSPCVEAPWWEVRGGGDRVGKGVDGDGNAVDVRVGGERRTKTGKLCVRMPGGHVLTFQDRAQTGGFLDSLKPLYFNRKKI